MRVSDVADAFPNLPLHPDVWQYCLFRFFGSAGSDALQCYVHLMADFGAAGCPGTFHLFYVRGVVQMARAEHVLTLPMAVCHPHLRHHHRLFLRHLHHRHPRHPHRRPSRRPRLRRPYHRHPPRHLPRLHRRSSIS